MTVEEVREETFKILANAYAVPEETLSLRGEPRRERNDRVEEAELLGSEYLDSLRRFSPNEVEILTHWDHTVYVFRVDLGDGGGGATAYAFVAPKDPYGMTDSREDSKEVKVVVQVFDYLPWVVYDKDSN